MHVQLGMLEAYYAKHAELTLWYWRHPVDEIIFLVLCFAELHVVSDVCLAGCFCCKLPLRLWKIQPHGCPTCRGGAFRLIMSDLTPHATTFVSVSDLVHHNLRVCFGYRYPCLVIFALIILWLQA